MILQQLGLVAAEETVGVLGKAPQVAVELLIPVGELALPGQVLDLVDEAGAQAAAIHFLPRPHIELADQVGDLRQGLLAPGVGQQMLPATGEGVMVTLGADTDLEIYAQQPQYVSMASCL